MNDQVLAVSVEEAGRRLGVCSRTVSNLIRAKELLSRKIGRRRVIPITALEAFLRRDHVIATPVATHAVDAFKTNGTSPPAGANPAAPSAHGGAR